MLPGRPRRCDYRIAERRVASTHPLSALAAFQVARRGDAEAPALDRGTPLRALGAAGCSVFLAGRERPCWRRDDRRGTAFHFDGLGTLHVAADGTAIDGRELAAGLPPATVEEIVLGPGLVLCLAADGVTCLHASAVRTGAGAVLFLGDSGSGKSTLAARLGAGGHPLLADDVLPVEARGSAVDALPAFPQLKLPPGEQPGVAGAGRLPVAAICALDPAAETVGWEECAGAAALALLIRHTVGARLFAGPLLEGHLSACGLLAERLSVVTVGYPHRSDSPGILGELLRQRYGAC